MVIRPILAALLIALGTGSALAGDCTQDGTTSGNSGSILFFNFFVDSGLSQTCAVSNPVKVPAGTYGVFKVDSQGYVELQNGEKVKLAVVSSGQSHSKTLNGPYADAVTYSAYYSTGLVAADTSFSGTATVDATGASDAFSYGEYDALDIRAGFTTLASIKGGLSEISTQQTGLVTHLDLDAGLLTGAFQPLEGQNEVGVFGALGSYDFGATGRFNLSQGFSVLGGISAVSLSVPGASASGVMGSAALRFVQPDGSGFRWFAEGGLEGATLGLNFSRHYSNGTVASYEAKGSGDGLLGAGYVRGGVVWQPDADNEIVFSASVKGSALGVSKYSEVDPITDPNLFSADLSGHTSGFTTVKAGADWTTALQQNFDLTTSVAVGSTFGSGASADVFGVGNVSGAAKSTLFAQYGVRLGYAVTPTSKIDGFVQGTTGTGIGTHLQAGAGYHLKF